MIRTAHDGRRPLALGALPVILLACAPIMMAAGGRTPATPPDLGGVYQTIRDDVRLAGGLRNIGGPAAIALLPSARDLLKTIDLANDPDRRCQPLGPFRKMSRPRMKFELVPALAKGMMVMLFEDVSHGHMRTVFIDRVPPAPVPMTWHGRSVGRWESGTLVVDTVGFNERTWLNGAGAQHSDALHTVERFRPILKGRYLEYKMTAEDPPVLATPYTYTRYFEKLGAEITEGLGTEVEENVCEPRSLRPCGGDRGDASRTSEGRRGHPRTATTDSEADCDPRREDVDETL